MTSSGMAFLRRISGSKFSPILLSSAQAGGLMCVGDIISQKVIEKQEKFDYGRNFRFGCIGFFMVGPVLRVWYGVLETRIALKTPTATAVAKVAADQLLMAPVFLANFITINSLLQGNSLSVAKDDLQKSYRDILLSNYELWPPVQFINFTLIPLQFRVLFVQTVAVLWNTYLSWKTNTDKKP